MGKVRDSQYHRCIHEPDREGEKTYPGFVTYNEHRGIQFLSTCAEVSSSSNTNQVQDFKPGFQRRTQLHVKPEEVLSTPESSRPLRGVLDADWVLSAPREKGYSYAERLNITFLSFVDSQQPCCFLYIN